jgi:hypothetical protein
MARLVPAMSRSGSYIFDDHLLLHGFFVHACAAAHTTHAWHTGEGHFVCLLYRLNESGCDLLLRRAVLLFCCRIPTHPVQAKATFGGGGN